MDERDLVMESEFESWEEEDDDPFEGIPWITKETLRGRIHSLESSSGYTLEGYKQAIAEGKIVNYSLALLSMWEDDVKLLKEMEERDPD